MEYLEGRGIVHRDLAARNVLGNNAICYSHLVVTLHRFYRILYYVAWSSPLKIFFLCVSIVTLALLFKNLWCKSCHFMWTCGPDLPLNYSFFCYSVTMLAP